VRRREGNVGVKEVMEGMVGGGEREMMSRGKMMERLENSISKNYRNQI
jgi:hypothetical protein